MAQPARIVLLALLLASAAIAPAPAYADAEGRAAQPEEAVRQVVRLLASPLGATRAQGAVQLGELLQGTHRAEVLALLDSASPAVLPELIPVIAADAAPDAIRALARKMVVASDVPAHAIMLALARQPDVVTYLEPKLAKDKKALHKLVADPKRIVKKVGKERLDALAQLIYRAHLERLLVSRKSKWGGTGYYQGQYEQLAAFGHHELALEVCVGVALDEAMPLPGVFRSGFYEFLHPHEVDIWELRGMAINAVGELATPKDTVVIARLDARFKQLWRRIVTQRRDLLEEARDDWDLTRSKRFQDDVFALGRVTADAADFLLCLYLIQEDEYRERLDDFIMDLERGWRQPVVPQHVDGMVPGILIRARRYAEAVTEYKSELYRSFSSHSFIYYNMACAYASWSRDPGTESAEELRRKAASALLKSFRKGWRDLGWMEEDRDLDPIREMDTYKHVVRLIREDLDLPK